MHQIEVTFFVNNCNNRSVEFLEKIWANSYTEVCLKYSELYEKLEHSLSHFFITITILNKRIEIHSSSDLEQAVDAFYEQYFLAQTDENIERSPQPILPNFLPQNIDDDSLPKKGHRIEFRCTQAEKNLINSKAASANMTTSEYARRMATNGKVVHFTPELKREINSIANNTNQYMKKMHIGYNDNERKILDEIIAGYRIIKSIFF